MRSVVQESMLRRIWSGGLLLWRLGEDVGAEEEALDAVPAEVDMAPTKLTEQIILSVEEEVLALLVTDKGAAVAEMEWHQQEIGDLIKLIRGI